MTERIITEPSANHWHETDRQIATSNRRDRQTAREVNAEWFLINAEPFGSLPGAA